ncbi:uncharacterized protein LOC121235076 isoform X1 [Juglans microcarpa x Juglans regia]|uniref:uncharacterized protein LOC121235076 isoform X1 n=1 Tax=Juglans microcarpa x Juglans regia TaxID=2249226 RepID=UPI001B7E3B4E|nr:uncharacterized protein LOC121235076 isoform X1 [Juglans microcarpa x Juglans regia]
MEGYVQYPKIELEDCHPKVFSRLVSKEVEECREKSNLIRTGAFEQEERTRLGNCGSEAPKGAGGQNDVQDVSGAVHKKQGKFFYYDAPLSEETGTWIPVSAPRISDSEHEEWNGDSCINGEYIPDEELGWNRFDGVDKELTMWDVVTEMLVVARGRFFAIASGGVHGCKTSRPSEHMLEQAWKEMAQTLTEANFGNMREILEAEPPQWLADSAASSCMLCNVRFHPIMRSRHHCRFCGGIFCSSCSKGRCLLPTKFRTGNPERVCDVCFVRLESVQSYLIDRISRAAQLPTHDLTDLSTLRSWLNFPWGQSMEYEIYKATNTIEGYNKVGTLTPEKSIPDAIWKQARGLAILTVAKVGVVVTYNIGTGLVIARREDGSWSPPSAISSWGVGWGAQVEMLYPSSLTAELLVFFGICLINNAGGEVTDFIIVLRNKSAVQTFSGNVHFSVGAGLSAAAGSIGRAAEADVRAGDGGYAACYTYSCSKGAFIGCSLEGSIVTTRSQENSRFYGNPSISAEDILLGSLPTPPAAAVLYQALSNLFEKFER